MSRCFPYPPPGYSGEEGSGQALIDSIKLQRERELAKAEAKKDRKREKKEKRKHKKEHKKDKIKTSLLPDKKIHKGHSQPAAQDTVVKNETLLKLLQSENEQLERSSLTEEHTQPVAEQKPSTSSDSTQNSSKRKRESSPPAVARQEENSIRSTGNVIRIRLSSQKANVLVSKHDPSSTTFARTELPLQKPNAIISRQQPCSTSGRTEFTTTTSLKHGRRVGLSSVQPGSNSVFKGCPPIPEAVLVNSTSGRTELATTADKHGRRVGLSSVKPGNNNMLKSCPPIPEAVLVNSTSGRTELATTTADKHGRRVGLSSVQPGNNNVLKNCPPIPEAVLVNSASVPKSLTRDDNANVAGQSQPCKELPKRSLLPIPDREVCTTSIVPKPITVSDPKSVHKKSITSDDVAVRDPKSLDKKLVKAELRYRDLFMNWMPPLPQMEVESDDQDWLFDVKKNPENHSEKKLKPSYNLVRGSNTSLWPRAQFIPEADIYALPFTVPF